MDSSVILIEGSTSLEEIIAQENLPLVEGLYLRNLGLIVKKNHSEIWRGYGLVDGMTPEELRKRTLRGIATNLMETFSNVYGDLELDHVRKAVSFALFGFYDSPNSDYHYDGILRPNEAERLRIYSYHLTGNLHTEENIQRAAKGRGHRRYSSEDNAEFLSWIDDEGLNSAQVVGRLSELGIDSNVASVSKRYRRLTGNSIPSSTQLNWERSYDFGRGEEKLLDYAIRVYYVKTQSGPDVDYLGETVSRINRISEREKLGIPNVTRNKLRLAFRRYEIDYLEQVSAPNSY